MLTRSPKWLTRQRIAQLNGIVNPTVTRLTKQSTMVQPDILAVCDRSRILEKVCWGTPDLVIEVLSPSSRSHDCILKLRKYKNAGVREYWIVDPEHLMVIVYEFLPEEKIRIYTFDDIVPVGISDGKCSVDFSEILREIKDLS